ncbi:hypothetical protein FN846DRAFT_969080 [Sphaerosporella brunnea]|uniref:Uncharacterized protein n=1 Tax=Sphaerosporella brunnea TaxID=1250544 RepID=A0A5J5EIJ5_9PEZI|nr:hypothetical protein FN846DRAFT_969080 [Sphaerosporella brunnea]
MPPINWDNFSAFQPPGRLDRSILARTMTGGLHNLQADVDKFKNWIETLRNNTEQCGIPENRVADVQLLLQEFFPAGSAPIRIRDEEYAPYNPKRKAKPCNVQFGAEELQIVDGPAALGYIFSVAKPPMDNPTWESYYLPLLVIYSKCLYLSYITIVPGNANAKITDVPVMSCLMYIRPQNEPPHSFMFGSTWTSTAYDADVAALEFERKSMLDDWRKALLKTALDHVPLQDEEPKPTLPTFEPLYWNELCQIFYRDFRGRKQPTQVPVTQRDVAAQTTETLRKTIIATLKQVQPGLPDPVMIDVNQLANNFRTKNNLQTCLLNLIRLRFQNPYDRTSDQVINAYKALIAFYITPHLFPADPTGKIIADVEIPVPSTLIDPAVATLWAIPGTPDRALDKLDVLHTEQTQGDHPPTRPYGRCAETYCVVCMLPNYFPANTTESLGNVRGFSLEVRVLGQSTTFDDHFTSAEVDGSGSKGPYRLPCENCQSLLPLYKLRTGQAFYDADIFAVPPQTHPAH